MGTNDWFTPKRSRLFTTVHDKVKSGNHALQSSKWGYFKVVFWDFVEYWNFLGSYCLLGILIYGSIYRKWGWLGTIFKVIWISCPKFMGRTEMMSIFRTLHHSAFWKTIYLLLGDISYNFRPIFKLGWIFQTSGDLRRFSWPFIETWLISSAMCYIMYNKAIMQDKGPTHLQILKKVCGLIQK